MSDNHDTTTDGALRIAVMQKQKLDAIGDSQSQNSDKLEDSIGDTEALLKKLGKDLPKQEQSQLALVKTPAAIPARPWEDILAEAKQVTPEDVTFSDVLSETEIQSVLNRHNSIGRELGWFESLDRFDVAVAVSAGVIAGLIDVLLVKVPKHPGFLGSKASEGGWLSNIIKEKSGQLLPEDTIRHLEKSYKTPYDPAVNSTLSNPVAGLGPRTHRYHSLGHDPWLGFIFGIRDILTGKFTAIDKFGKVIIQRTGSPLAEGETFIIRILEAMKIHLGHLLSDVATPAGLPAPLMPLITFLQFGKIGDKEYTISEVARQMYRAGYDFRHFIASAIPVAITELIIRLSHFIKSKINGIEDDSAFYSRSSLNLRRKLLIANSVGMFINAGKVSVTQNPLSISWAQILAYLWYVAPEVGFMLHGKEGIRAKMVEDNILEGYQNLNSEIDTFLNDQPNFVIQL